MAQHGGLLTGEGLDPAMPAVAARRARTPLIVADAQRLPFDNATFDGTVAVTLCEFVTDPHLTVGELSRVTRRGGRFAPGALPGLDKVGPLLEGLGRAFPRFGAFQVLVIGKAPS